MSDRIDWWRIQFGEAEQAQMTAAVDQRCISQGPLTAQFEARMAEMLDVPHVVATTSGSMALYVSLLAHGIGPGDEVMMPNRAWIATAHAARLVGASVRLIDDEPDRPVMDLGDLLKKISPRTKAVMPVHLNGRAVDMPQLNRIAEEHGLVVIEDAAQALLSRNAAGYLGCQSAIGCFSMSLAKLMSTGQGGFMATRDEGLWQRLCSLRTHGVENVLQPVYTTGGFNFRFNDILASFALVQVDRLPARVKRLIEIYRRYETGLAGLDFLRLVPVDVASGEVPLYSEVSSERRDEVIRFLDGEGIQARPFYPTVKTARYLGCEDELPHSTRQCGRSFFLPCGPDQSDDNIQRVIETLRRFPGR